LKSKAVKKDLQLLEQPKVGEYYDTTGNGIIKIVGIKSDGFVEYHFTDSMFVNDWDWEKYYCRKLTSLEIELL
jgi:hypothetical protein